MRILVLMQNAWKWGAVEGQTKWWPAASDEDSDLAWQDALWRSQSGIRLREMLPEDCDVYVGNASPLIGPVPRSKYSMDAQHVITLLNKHSPDVVLLLGKEAARALWLVEDKDIRAVLGPHPASRSLSKATTADIKRDIEKQEVPSAKGDIADLSGGETGPGARAN